YLCPYSHEIWHGIVLAVVLIACAAKWLNPDTEGDRIENGARPLGRFNVDVTADLETAHDSVTSKRRKRRAPEAWLFLAGLCYGLIFLAKPENFLAATAVVIGIFLLQQSKTAAFKSWLLFVLATLLPLVGYFLIFFAQEDFSNSVRGVCWAWVPLVTTHMASGPFFKTGMGFDVPLYHGRLMLQHFAVLAAIVGVCVWRFRASQNRIERLVLLCVLAGLAINFDWTHCGRSLPLIVLSALAALFFRWKKESTAAREKLVVPILWFVFALFLLPKMGLFPRISHYGVFLAMPAFLGAVYFLVYLLPQLFPHRIDAKYFRPATLMLISIGLTRLAVHSTLFYNDKDFSVGEGGDRIVTYGPKISPQGEGIARAVAWLKANAPPNATVAALPEGVMINYLSHHPNPTPYIVFMSEIYAFGEEKMAVPYRASPPDYILLVHRETGEYGLDFFGKKKGYGLEMLQWINANYETVELIGSEPLQTSKFGIKILKRKILTTDRHR
ncbi:MAG: hypothetical protein JWM68_4627, partial [Verrucomicrobiales bacterium]|nr:hypothetical protein [Verrucomicrobiales bacterium]